MAGLFSDHIIPGMSSKCTLQLLLLLSYVFISHGLIDALYCGKRNCYRVLGVSRHATNAELSQAYHMLARQFHPDRNVDDGAKDTYYLAVTAYDTLIHDGTRKDYDYMLKYPEKIYTHYYRYYNRRFSPNVNIRGFIAVVIIIISVMQYLYQKHSFSEAVRRSMKDPKHRNQYMQIIQQDGMLTENKRRLKNKKSKEEYKKEEERILRSMVETSIEDKGEYCKPHIFNTLLVQLLLSPYYFVCYMKWYTQWVWKFNYLKEPYTEEAKIYLICKGLEFTEKHWHSLSECSKDFYLKKELWIKENLVVYREEMEHEMSVSEEMDYPKDRKQKAT